ncbi:hypothetical protein [Streptomyces sp. NPDC093589]|uniref:hypothetical protein n=1 Tax=Streptomyces sp. NPDC093589 TaxID=3366043 RepID=UPI00382E885B
MASPHPRSPLNPRPDHFSDADGAEYQQCQAEHEDLMAQAADREAQMEHGLIDTHDEYDFDYSPDRTTQQSHPARQTPPLPLSPDPRRSGRCR